MATRAQWLQTAKDRGVSLDEALASMNTYRNEVGAFDDDPALGEQIAKTNENYLSVLESPNAAGADVETHAKNQLKAWYQVHTGTEFNDALLESRFKKDFGDTTSYGSAVNSLTNLYRTVPKGARKLPPMKRHVTAGDYLKHLGESFGSAMITAGAGLAALESKTAVWDSQSNSGYWFMMSQQDPVTALTWQKMAEQVEVEAHQAGSEVKKKFSKMMDVPQEVKDSFAGGVIGAVGNILAFSASGPLAPAVMFGALKQEGYETARQRRFDEQDSANIGTFYALIGIVPEYLGFKMLRKAKPLVRGKGGFVAFRNFAQSLKRMGLGSAVETLTELFQQVEIDALTGTAPDPVEYAKLAATTFAASTFFTGAEQVGFYRNQKQTGERLETEFGFSPEEAAKTAADLANAESEEQAVEVLQKAAERNVGGVVEQLTERLREAQEAAPQEAPDPRTMSKEERVQKSEAGIGVDKFVVSTKPAGFDEDAGWDEIFSREKGFKDSFDILSRVAEAGGAKILKKNINTATTSAYFTFETIDKDGYDENYTIRISTHEQPSGGGFVVRGESPMEQNLRSGRAGEADFNVLIKNDQIDLASAIEFIKGKTRARLEAEWEAANAPASAEPLFTEPLTPFEARRIGEEFTESDIDLMVAEGEERELLKRAMRGDESALAELNQRIVGVEDDAVIADRTQADSIMEDLNMDAPLNEISKTAQNILNFGENLKSIAKKAVSLTTRIGEISPEVKMAVRKSKQQAHILESNAVQILSDFFTDIANLDASQSDAVKSMLLNGQYDELASLRIRGIDEVRAYLEQVAQELGIQQVENYFPRKVIDYEGLVNAIGSKPKGAFDAAIKAAEKKAGRKLSKEKRMSVIRGVLQQRNSVGFGQQSRTIDVVTDEMLPYYENPLETLQRYIHVASMARARKAALGTVGKVDGEFADVFGADGDFNITEVVSRLVAAESLPFDKQNELRELLSAELSYKTAPKWVNNYRRLVSLKYVTRVKTTVKQFADIFVSAGENGIANTIFAGGEQQFWKDELGRQVDLSLEEIGVQALDQEISELKRGKIESVLFKPLTFADVYNKVWLAKSTARKWRKMAEENPSALRQELVAKFSVESFVDSVMNGIKKNELNADVKFALYSQMADFHPISHAENIKFYVEHPATRFMFALKSFAFKRLDRFYRESLRDGIDGITTAVAGVVDGNQQMLADGAYKIAQSSVGMTRFLIFSILGEVFLDQVYKRILEILGLAPAPEDETEFGRWTDAYLQEFSTIAPFINPYAVRVAVDRKDPWTFVERSLAMPKPIGADVVADLAKWMMEDDKNLSEFTDWKKDVPYIGEFAAGVDRVKKKSKQKPKKWGGQ